MSQCDQNLVCEDAEEIFDFEPDNSGAFQFGHVPGQSVHRIGRRDGP